MISPMQLSWAVYWQIVQVMIVFDVALFVVILYFEWWRKRGRILVRIKRVLNEDQKWAKPEKDGKTIIMQKRKHDQAEWKFTFTRKSIQRVKRFFGLRSADCIDIMYNAPKAINYDFELKKADQPKFDKKTSQEFIQAETLRERGRGVKQALPTLFWLIMILIMIQIMISGYALMSRGY